MRNESEIQSRLEEKDIFLSEHLGQHILVDKGVLNMIANQVDVGSDVLEIGSGPGNLTERIAAKAKKVVGIEIDRRFQPLLEEVSNGNPNIRFVFSDALMVDFHSLVKQGEQVQIVANLPFHITEPFLSKLVDLPIESAVLLLGDSAAREIMEDERSPYYGKLSLIVQTFFNIRQISDIPKTSFYPQPRTDAILVELTPKEKEEIKANPANFVFAYLIRRAHKYGLVINEMKQALVDASRFVGRGNLSKKDANKRDRAEVKRQLKSIVLRNGIIENDNSDRRRPTTIISQADALEKISRMGINTDILQKPFFTLNNQEIQELVRSVKEALE